MSQNAPQAESVLQRPPEAASPTDLTITALSSQYLPLVYAYVARRVPLRQDAEDVAAEVFAAAFEALPKYRGQSSARAWLLGIARRKVAAHLRRRRIRHETLLSEMASTASLPASPVPGPEGAMQRAEAQRVLRHILSQLSGKQQEALLLQYEEELSIAEIAQVMRCSPAAVTGLLQRARATVFRLGHEYFLEEERDEK